VVEWTGTLVKFRHNYPDFDLLKRCSGCLELRLSVVSAVLTRNILQTIRATRENGQYIRVFETLTWGLDQRIRILQASVLPVIPVHPKYHFRGHRYTKPVKNQQFHNGDVLRKVVEGISTLSTCVSTVNAEALCRRSDVAMLWCHLWMDGWLIRTHSLALDHPAPLPCVEITLIVVCRREFIVVAIERLTAILPRCHSRLREMRWWDRMQGHSRKIERLEPQRVSSGIWNSSTWRRLSYPISFIQCLLVCFSTWWTGYSTSSNNIPGSTHSTSSGGWCLNILASLDATSHVARWRKWVEKRWKHTGECSFQIQRRLFYTLRGAKGYASQKPRSASRT